jgi:two-component system LytT family response regulator
LITDDEPEAREVLRLHLAGESDFHVVGECRSGAEAVSAIRELAPDLVFLDVRMPDMSGFEVLERLDDDRLPFVVFVTAYDEYALRAFEVHALAYLLKPFDDIRFEATIRHVQRLMDEGGTGPEPRLRELLQEIRSGSVGAGAEVETGATPATIDRLVVKSRGRTYFVTLDTVDWIEAAGNYVRLHCGEKTHLLGKTMSELERSLDSRRFVRIHRSSIVNVDRIKELRTEDHRDFEVVLDSGDHLRLSRTYKHTLESVVGDRI